MAAISRSTNENIGTSFLASATSVYLYQRYIRLILYLSACALVSLKHIRLSLSSKDQVRDIIPDESMNERALVVAE